jgi:SAM-dependent methyltransferase
MKTREEFYDGDDTAKWAGEAARQLEVYPPGQEEWASVIPFEQWLSKYNIDRNGTVVDFGCGTGLLRGIFEGMNYIGIDQNYAMLEGIEARWGGRDPKVCAYESPLTKITQYHPELIGVGDLGLFCTVLQHNHWTTAGEILHQAAQVLKPEAFLFMYEGTFDDKHYPKEAREKYDLPDPDPNRLECADGGAIFTPKGWEHFLGQHGFELLEYDGDCGYLSKRKEN